MFNAQTTLLKTFVPSQCNRTMRGQPRDRQLTSVKTEDQDHHIQSKKRNYSRGTEMLPSLCRVKEKAQSPLRTQNENIRESVQRTAKREHERSQTKGSTTRSLKRQGSLPESFLCKTRANYETRGHVTVKQQVQQKADQRNSNTSSVVMSFSSEHHLKNKEGMEDDEHRPIYRCKKLERLSEKVQTTPRDRLVTSCTKDFGRLPVEEADDAIHMSENVSPRQLYEMQLRYRNLMQLSKQIKFRNSQTLTGEKISKPKLLSGVRTQEQLNYTSVGITRDFELLAVLSVKHANEVSGNPPVPQANPSVTPDMGFLKASSYPLLENHRDGRRLKKHSEVQYTGRRMSKLTPLTDRRNARKEQNVHNAPDVLPGIQRLGFNETKEQPQVINALNKGNENTSTKAVFPNSRKITHRHQSMTSSAVDDMDMPSAVVTISGGRGSLPVHKSIEIKLPDCGFGNPSKDDQEFGDVLGPEVYSLLDVRKSFGAFEPVEKESSVPDDICVDITAELLKENCPLSQNFNDNDNHIESSVKYDPEPTNGYRPRLEGDLPSELKLQSQIKINEEINLLKRCSANGDEARIDYGFEDRHAQEYTSSDEDSKSARAETCADFSETTSPSPDFESQDNPMVLYQAYAQRHIGEPDEQYSNKENNSQVNVVSNDSNSDLEHIDTVPVVDPNPSGGILIHCSKDDNDLEYDGDDSETDGEVQIILEQSINRSASSVRIPSSSTIRSYLSSRLSSHSVNLTDFLTVPVSKLTRSVKVLSLGSGGASNGIDIPEIRMICATPLPPGSP